MEKLFFLSRFFSRFESRRRNEIERKARGREGEKVIILSAA
jgi:hypothetical protein